MKTNRCQGQIKGPFKANTDLTSIIAEDCDGQLIYLSHIGIQTSPGNIKYHPESVIEITTPWDNYTVEIGKTGMYEIGHTRITSIIIKEDKDNNFIIDYVAVVGDPEKPKRDSVL